jgi:single-strand DNA-binding protein
MNNYNVIGRVGKDAVTRQAGSEPVTGFSLAVDSGYGDKKQTLWLDCSLWGKRGEKVAQYITKGSQLGVSGELGTREHDGKTYLTLRVAEVSLIGGKPANSAPRQESTAPASEEIIPF